MRDKGWNNVDTFVKAGVTGGNALEIGPGPGYVGLEWLKRFPGAALTGCEISREMISLAQKNAREYGFAERTHYVEANCMRMPFADETFDAVFSNGSLHEWEDPVRVFNEIARVLTPGGVFCVSDMRRDVHPAIKWWIYSMTKPKEIRSGFLTSLNAAYTVAELDALIGRSELKRAATAKEFFGLSISGRKPARS
jgi:ubiquinone/menaquinone biosynthesis C-methylase UbiE